MPRGTRLDTRCTFVACNIASGVGGPVRFHLVEPALHRQRRHRIAAAGGARLRPRPALDGGNDGLDCYRAIAADAPRLLARGGRLIVELGAGQDEAVSALFTKAGLSVVETRKDLAGIVRALSAKLP